MVNGIIESVQLYNGTDNGLIHKNYTLSSQKTYYPGETDLRDRFTNLTRLHDRTIYPLRKARMQMRTRSRTWAKILPLGQLSWPSTRARLRAPEVSETSKAVYSQLSGGETTLRGNQFHQPGTFATKRKTVTAEEPNGYPRRTTDNHRYCSFRYPGGQYAPIGSDWSVRRNRITGGER